MANAFKNYLYQQVGTSNTTVYNPTTAGITSTIIGMSLCNVANAAIEVNVTMSVGNTAVNAGSNSVYLVKGAVIPKGSTLIPIGGDQKLVMEENDFLEVSSNTATSVDVLVSALEIT